MLTKEHIAVLKVAEDICFVHNHAGRSYVRAIKRAKEPCTKHLFGQPEAAIEIECESYVRSYGRDEGMLHDSDWRCFDMLHSARFKEEWQTVLSLLRPGHKLVLDWQRSAWNTTGLDRVGYVGDFLAVCVEDTKGKRMKFQIGHYIGPADSTARMVRSDSRSASIAA